MAASVITWISKGFNKVEVMIVFTLNCGAPCEYYYNSDDEKK